MGQKEAHSARVTGQHRPWERPRPIFHVPAGLSQVLLSPGAPHSCPPPPPRPLSPGGRRGGGELYTQRGAAPPAPPSSLTSLRVSVVTLAQETCCKSVGEGVGSFLRRPGPFWRRPPEGSRPAAPPLLLLLRPLLRPDPPHRRRPTRPGDPSKPQSPPVLVAALRLTLALTTNSFRDGSLRTCAGRAAKTLEREPPSHSGCSSDGEEPMRFREFN